MRSGGAGVTKVGSMTRAQSFDARQAPCGARRRANAVSEAEAAPGAAWPVRIGWMTRAQSVIISRRSAGTARPAPLRFGDAAQSRVSGERSGGAGLSRVGSMAQARNHNPRQAPCGAAGRQASDAPGAAWSARVASPTPADRGRPGPAKPRA